MDERAIDTLRRYNKLGMVLIPCTDKTPLIKWGHIDHGSQTWEQVDELILLYGTYCQWAIKCFEKYLVVDIDNRVDPTTNLDGHQQFEAITGIHKDLIHVMYSCTQKTRSGGRHIVYRMPEGLKGARVAKNFAGCSKIDVKHGNAYILVPPSEGYEMLGSGIEDADELPGEMIPHVLSNICGKIEALGSDGTDDVPSNITKEYLIDLMAEMKKCDLTYHQWIQAGMAIHSWNSTIDGLELFLDLTQCQSYQDGDLDKASDKWRSFKSGDTSIKSLMYLARSLGVAVKNPHSTAMGDFAGIVGWAEINGKMITEDEDFLVQWFNERDIYFHSNFPEGKCYLTLRDMVDDGARLLISSSIKKVKNEYPNYFLSYMEGNKCKLKSAADVWASHKDRNIVNALTFNPRTKNKVIGSKLNLFGGFPINKHKEKGNDQIIRDLIHQSICNYDDVKFQWLIKWIAHIFQRPYEKSSLVPVIIGEQGTGKGFLTERILGSMLGNMFTMTSNTNDITGFNSLLASKLLICFNEATWRGKHEVNNIIKSITGDASLVINEKFMPQYTLDNYARIIITSNSNDAVNYEHGNRRFVFFDNGNSWTKNIKKFNALKSAIDHENYLGKFYHSLMQEDLSTFEPHDISGLEGGGTDIKMSSMDDVDSFWLDMYENPRPVFYEGIGLSMGHVYHEYDKWCNVHRPWKRTSEKGFWSKSKKIFKIEYNRKRVRIEGVRSYVLELSFHRVIEHLHKYFSLLNENCLECDESMVKEWFIKNNDLP